MKTMKWLLRLLLLVCGAFCYCGVTMGVPVVVDAAMTTEPPRSRYRPRTRTTTTTRTTSPAANKRQRRGSTNNNSRGYELRQRVGNNINHKGKRSKRPPQWEKEGDSLYQELRLTSNRRDDTSDNNDASVFPSNAVVEEGKTITYQMAEELLSKITIAKKEEEPPINEQQHDGNNENNKNDHNNNNDDDDDSTTTTTTATKVPPTSFSSGGFLWGSLSVGPVVKQRLDDAKLFHPTPIQSAAYAAMTAKNANDNNFIVSSPTGTGKSLAYLLPLLVNPKAGKRIPGMTVIVTPTLQLAYQLQREVDRLFPPNSDDDDSGSKKKKKKESLSLLHVVDYTATTAAAAAAGEEEEENDNNEESLVLLHHENIGKAPMIAGTPRSLRKLAREIKSCFDDDNGGDDPNRPQPQPPKSNNKSKSNKNEKNSNPVLDQLLLEMEQFSQQEEAKDPATTTTHNKRNNNNNNNNDNNNKATATRVANTICSNLQTIVFDEADRLFQTEQVARAAAAKAVFKKATTNNPTTTKKNKKQKKKTNQNNKKLKTTQSEHLYQEITALLRRHRDGGGENSPNRRHDYWGNRSRNHNYYPRNDNNNNNKDDKSLQIVCASATIGRTLRRQLMELLDTTSLDQAATLVTAANDPKTKKDPAMRKKSLLPPPSLLTHSVCLLPDNNCDDTLVVEILWKILRQQQQQLATATTKQQKQQQQQQPVLIFPGKTGVPRVRKGLEELGWNNIQTLASSSSCLPATNGNPADTPIYIIGERFGRGLDIPNTSTVIILTPPSSTAGYVHLAGRTARNGQKGNVVTFCKPKEIPKLLSISKTLGVSFRRIFHGDNNDNDNNNNNNNNNSIIDDNNDEKKKNPKQQQKENEASFSSSSSFVVVEDDDDDDETNNNPSSLAPPTLSWSHLSDSTIQRKTIAAMTDYLKSHDVVLPRDNNKKIKKADLIDAIRALHRNDVL